MLLGRIQVARKQHGLCNTLDAGGRQPGQKADAAVVVAIVQQCVSAVIQVSQTCRRIQPCCGFEMVCFFSSNSSIVTVRACWED